MTGGRGGRTDGRRARCVTSCTLPRRRSFPDWGQKKKMLELFFKYVCQRQIEWIILTSAMVHIACFVMFNLYTHSARATSGYEIQTTVIFVSTKCSCCTVIWPWWMWVWPLCLSFLCAIVAPTPIFIRTTQLTPQAETVQN